MNLQSGSALISLECRYKRVELIFEETAMIFPNFSHQNVRYVQAVKMAIRKPDNNYDVS